MSDSNAPRARRPITPSTRPVPPRVGGNQRTRKRVRIVLGFGIALVLCVLMILISLAF